MGAKDRILKKNCPGGKWPEDFAWLRCAETNCAAGAPAQDKNEFPRHYVEFHPDVDRNHLYDNLIRCTFKEQKDHLKHQKSLPGGGAPSTMHTAKRGRVTAATTTNTANAAQTNPFNLRPPPPQLWSCTLCDAPIGSLETTVEHIKDCHAYVEMHYDHGRKMIHAEMEEGEIVEEEELVSEEGAGRTWLLVGRVE